MNVDVISFSSKSPTRKKDIINMEIKEGGYREDTQLKLMRNKILISNMMNFDGFGEENDSFCS